MSGILNDGPAMGPLRLMYMTRCGVSWVEISTDLNIPGYLGHRLLC